jgi:hypothetical protein
MSAGHDRLGSTLTIRLGEAAAAVIAAETSTHVNHQMLVMLGDTVVAAAIVRAPLHEDILITGLFDDQQRDRLTAALRRAAAGRRAISGSCT